MDSYLKKLKLFDLVVIFYCLLTGIYMLLGINQLQNLSFHLLLRILFLSIIFILLKAEGSKNKIVHFFRNFYPLLFLGFFYSETDYYNNLVFKNFDPLLIMIENLLFGTQFSLEFSKLVPFQWFSELMHFGYFSYYLMTFGVPLLFYLKARNQFDKVMFMVILSFSFYYLLFILFPSIGPQFYFPIDERIIPEGYFFQKAMNIIITIGESQTGAFPSSHVGMAMFYIILLIKYFKKIQFFLIPLVFILILSTVYLKAHYVIDVFAGAITGILFYFISANIYLKFYE